MRAPATAGRWPLCLHRPARQRAHRKADCRCFARPRKQRGARPTPSTCATAPWAPHNYDPNRTVPLLGLMPLRTGLHPAHRLPSSRPRADAVPLREEPAASRSQAAHGALGSALDRGCRPILSTWEVPTPLSKLGLHGSVLGSPS